MYLGIFRSCYFFTYFQQYGDAFYLYTDSRYRLILSDKYVDMLRNEKRLDFITALADVSQIRRKEHVRWKAKAKVETCQWRAWVWANVFDDKRQKDSTRRNKAFAYSQFGSVIPISEFLKFDA